MAEDRDQRSEGLWTCLLTASFGTEMDALDPRVCPLISVLRSLEIVKRVVTVKQVQPFRLAGPGHGYASAKAQALAQSEAYARLSESRSQGTAVSHRGRSPASGSDLCSLISVLCQARGCAACLGLGVGELERRASGECLGTERR